MGRYHPLDAQNQCVTSHLLDFVALAVLVSLPLYQIPASPFQAGKLNKLVWRSLHTSHSQSPNVIDLKSPNAPDLLVYVYNMYQQSRNSILPLLERVANATVDVPGFLVATYDAGANYVDPSLVTGSVLLGFGVTLHRMDDAVGCVDLMKTT
jgi:hypothetical protein